MNYTLENEFILIEVNTLGAELQRFYDKTRDTETLWNGNADYWARRSPVLFPNVGRLKNDSYTFEGKEYHLSQHGFARDKAFIFVEKTDTTLTFKLISNADTKKVYPFDFELICTYVLIGSTVRVRYDVVNTGENTMYYSIGAHPAFHTHKKFEDYTVALYGLGEFKRYMLEIPYVIDNSVETVINPHLELEREWFAMDAVIYETDLQQVSVDVYNKENHGMRVSFKNAQYIGIWSPYPKEAPFVCIEPWQGIADTTTHNGDLTTKKGIQSLKPNETGVFEYEMTVF